MTQPCSAQPPIQTHCTNTLHTASHITTIYTGMAMSVENKRKLDNAVFVRSVLSRSGPPWSLRSTPTTPRSEGARGSADPAPPPKVCQDTSIFTTLGTDTPKAVKSGAPPPPTSLDAHTMRYKDKYKDASRKPTMVADKRLLLDISLGMKAHGHNIKPITKNGSGHIVDHGVCCWNLHLGN